MVCRTIKKETPQGVPSECLWDHGMSVGRCMFCCDQCCTDLDPLQLVESRVPGGSGSDR